MLLVYLWIVVVVVRRLLETSLIQRMWVLLVARYHHEFEWGSVSVGVSSVRCG